MRFLVDTLSFRCYELNFENLCKFLGLDFPVSWEDGTPRYGYPEAKYFNGIIIYYGGHDGFESYLHMSGKGCRMYEDLYKKRYGHDLDWHLFFEYCLSLKIKNTGNSMIHFSRIDIACDDYTDRLKVDRLVQYYKSGKYTSRCKHWVAGQLCEEWLYIGSPQSDMRLRIYNKKIERGFNEEDLDGEPWYRAEFQLRDDRATEFIKKWVELNDIGKTFMGVLNNYVRFLTKPNDKKNAQRIPSAQFWKSFTSDAEKIRLVSPEGSIYNMENLYKYLKQTFSSLRTYTEALGMSPEDLFLHYGGAKLRQDQIAFIEAFRSKNFGIMVDIDEKGSMLDE